MAVSDEGKEGDRKPFLLQRNKEKAVLTSNVTMKLMQKKYYKRNNRTTETKKNYQI